MNYKLLMPMLLLLVNILYGKENVNTYCFESPYIFIGESTKVKKVVIHFEDVNTSTEYSIPTRMFYMLENDNHRYKVKDLLIGYDKNTKMYQGGGECDGGWLEFNTTNNTLSMEDLRLSGLEDILPPLEFRTEPVKLDDTVEDIVEISNLIYGWMHIGFLDKNKRIESIGKKFWITGRKCTDAEDIKGSKIFYTEKEYLEAFKNAKKEDEYIHLFNEPFVERKELDAKIETIKLKKSYSNIADMMSAEGFNFEWIKSYRIKFFLHNNKRAFIRVTPNIPDNAQSTCFCGGYYLLELHQNILKKMDFGWECGSMVTPKFEAYEVIVPVEGK